MPEKSAKSVKALFIPIACSVLSRDASAAMENFGRNRSKELKKTEPQQSESQSLAFITHLNMDSRKITKLNQ